MFCGCFIFYCAGDVYCWNKTTRSVQWLYGVMLQITLEVTAPRSCWNGNTRIDQHVLDTVNINRTLLRPTPGKISSCYTENHPQARILYPRYLQQNLFLYQLINHVNSAGHGYFKFGQCLKRFISILIQLHTSAIILKHVLLIFE